MWTRTTRWQYSRGKLRYEIDLSHKEWRLIAVWMPPQSTQGRPMTWSWREIMNAIFYTMTPRHSEPPGPPRLAMKPRVGS
jgi:hypothetical protein